MLDPQQNRKAGFTVKEKEQNHLTPFHLPKGSGKVKGEGGGGGPELQLQWFKSILIMSHGLAVYMKDNGRVQLIMIGLPLQ